VRILGISCHYHDAAACLYGDDGVIAAAEEERFSRRKHDAAFPSNAIAWVLDHAGINASDLDHVMYYEKPVRKFERILAMTVDAYPVGISHFVPAMRSWLVDKLWVASRIRKLGYRGEVLYAEHHLSHAASAYYPSPFDGSAVLTMDGVGERATTTIGRGEDLDLELIEEVHFPHSIGLLYSVFTAFLGFEVNEGEYKLMGLAAYGRPRYANQIRRLIEFNSDASYRLDTRYLAYPRTAANWTRALEEIVGPPVRRGALEDRIDERAADIAASVQLVTEEAIVRVAEHARELTGSRRLCFAGGVAQNVLANGRLLRDRIFDEVYVPSAPGDSGGALGAAAYLAHMVLRRRRVAATSPYLGPAFSATEVGRAIAESGLPSREVGREGIVREAARMIAEGRIVGWFQGRMEFGPRALGARSILADPRDPSVRDKLNARVKLRESFRPFAPAVVAERAGEYFIDTMQSPFMSFAARVRPEASSRIQAVVHADGTARLQTVAPDAHPIFYALLRELGRVTGYPLVLNTSFNIRGEPIVATPLDALECFARTSLDALFMETFVVLPGPTRTAPRHAVEGRATAAVPVA
jgi:carbamoyltransferase